MRPNLITPNMKKLITSLLFALFAMQIGWAQFTVSGTITTENGDPVSGVTLLAVPITGNIAITDANGHFQFVLPAGTSVDIVPFNNNDPLNGVSTFDRVLVAGHVNGTLQLDSPYKIIAADVDKSTVLDGADTLAIQELVTGVIQNFPNNNTSWRFVDANFVFPNPANPFVTGFTEFINITNVNSNITDLDFIAVKVGDVNGSAITMLNPDTGYLSKITGKVYFDQDETCTETTGDTPQKNWKVVATGTGGSFYANTNANGNYTLFLPPGTYDVEVVQANQLWAACTAIVPGVTVDFQGTATVDFAEQAVEDCPLMEVELSAWFLRRCFENSYFVSYCNQGTITATDASVEVTLDPLFINVSSTLPWSSVNGNTYTFDLGDIAVGDCGSFAINFEVSCDAELGQTHCTYAHIYPDETCQTPSPLWSGADLVVTGECVGDEVIFTITNQGEDMTEPVEYVVIEDVMIQMSEDDLLLLSGQSTTVAVPANGSTWRLQTDEATNHPFETFASATVEGCAGNGNEVSFGFVNQFPMPDGKPFEDLDCLPNIGAYDPNDKTGFPLGVSENHFINRGQDINYLIRFQNTGTDTAFNIVVIDSLPETLDPASIRLLGSSHPFEFELSGHGVAKFIFPNIMLPDSNVNEALSHGFVKFKIAQHPGLPLGTTIENEAGIYFDFNEPIVTNRSLHTLGEDFLIEVSSTETLLKGVEMEVFPNPFEATTNFRFKGIELAEGMLTVFDQQGRPISATPFTGSTCRYDGTGLASGVYFFKVENAGQGVSSGKLVVK